MESPYDECHGMERMEENDGWLEMTLKGAPQPNEEHGNPPRQEDHARLSWNSEQGPWVSGKTRCEDIFEDIFE